MQTPTYRPGDPVKIRARRDDASIGNYSPDAYEYLDDVVTAVGTRIVRTKRYPNGFRIEGGHRNDDRRPEAKIHSLDEYNTRARVIDASHRLRDLNVSVYHGKYTADTLEQLIALLEAAPENQQPTATAA
ncbi:hypothetical protein [Curtobacterium sp. MCSS17_016]|uniref:beta barrel domain-containing protein n=1 Tax=Curtobacterium sp. MCSS17_016 TaxID=2175644 RepID=UPI000DA8F8AE|nr:hypothetical protein [Curtobacterium sp. MCSS17_016]WIE81243.1 hypothetical protein DEJ19_018590 [Curtobacterium sp. MCSS17_016]